MAPRTHWLIAVSALLPLAFQQPAAAQDAARAYAQGVQAYFNGGASRAEGLLDQAAGLNPRDPLVYYFRGLAKLRQGRRHEAIEDFRIGATFEAKRPSGSLGIGRTLERVQGGNRLLLEQIRRETREGYEIAVVEEEQTRYQPTRDRGERALRSDFRLPLSMLAADSHPDALANLVAEQAESAGDPFADEPAPPAGTDKDATASAEALPAPAGGAPQTPIEVPDAARGAVSTKELGGIFGGMIKSLLPKNPLPAGGPFEAAPPAGDDPFGAQPAESNPFGAEPAEDDPFGAPAAEDNPFDSAPADGPAAPVEDDPFGAEPVPPAADTSEPAADPFGDAGDDPFGGADDEDPFGGEDPF